MVPPASPLLVCGMCLRVALQALQGIVIGRAPGLRKLILGSLLGPGVSLLVDSEMLSTLCLIERVDAPDGWSWVPCPRPNPLTENRSA